MGVGTVSGEVENTLGSFLAVVDAGLRWVEVDVRRTADDVLVAKHDPIVADGRFVAALTAGETDALGLLRVADLLDALPAGVGIDVEIKTSLEDALRPRDRTTAALAAGLLAQERRDMLVSSFDPAALVIVRELAPALPVGLLTWMRYPLRKAIPAAVHLGAGAVVPHVSSLGFGSNPVAYLDRPAAQLVAVAHDAGLEVAVWCPTPGEADPLIAAGVDCLIVDHASTRTWAGAAGSLR